MRESFGEFWKEILRIYSPDEYQRLVQNEELEQSASDAQANADYTYESTLAALRDANPPPPGADALQVAAHLSGLASAAREIVLHDLAMENDELRRIDQEGYQD